MTAPSSPRSLLRRSSPSQDPHTEEGHHLCFKDHHVGRLTLPRTTISFCVYNTILHHMTGKQWKLADVSSGGIVVVWWLLLCVQLLALLSGSDSSGVAWASLCAVWVPAGIGCTCLVALLCDVWLVSLGNICAPQIVFVAWQLYMMYKFTSGSASLSRLENPKGLLWEIYIDWLIDWE